MVSEECKREIIKVELQDNGIIRNMDGKIIASLDKYTDLEFEARLRKIINQTCQENDSNTPDFILAQYMVCCLSAFTTATQQRETWYGRDARPSFVADSPLEPTTSQS